MSDVEMPALGESVTEGTVTRWLKQVGDTVEVDEPLLEVSTDKVDTEIPSPVAGTLQEILVEEDETVEVGAKLAVIGDGAPSGGGDGGSSEQEAPAEKAPSEQQESSGSGSGKGAGDGGKDEAEQPAAEQAREEQPSGGSGGGGRGGGAGGGGGTPVTMPALGESVTEGTVTRWLKSEGDTVEVDEPLLEVSTDKVDTEIPSPVAGTVQKILVGEDETVEVGAELAIVGDGASGSGDGGGEESREPSRDSGEAEDTGAEDGGGGDGGGEESLADEAADQEAARGEAEEKTAPSSGGGHATGDEVRAKPDDEAGAKPGGAAPEEQAGSQDAPAQPTAKTEPGTPSAGDGSGTYVTPLVRKLAAQHDVDLASVTGTGVGGRVRKQDVLDAAEAQKTKAAETPAQERPAAAQAPTRRAEVPASVAAKRGTTEKMTRLRKVIAQRMVESLQVSAQLTTVVEVDVTRIARLRARAKDDFAAREGVKLSFLPFFALAAVEALKAHPTVNASVEGDQIAYHAQENLGIAVDTERGLLVPVIRDAGDLNIAGIARKIADLAKRTRENKVTPDELGGGTFTLTNTGSRGALFDTPIINQPQVAILGTGTVVKRPMVVPDADGGESIAVRSMIYLALSYDHRIVDGADAARFLATMKDRLEEGAFEADLGL